MSLFSICFVTTPTMEVAQRIAGDLVRRRLIACANIVPQVTSVYEWKGEICTDSEHLVIMKTQTAHVASIVEQVKMLHPYELPEVISAPLGEGSPDYLKWVLASTTASVAPPSKATDAAASTSTPDGNPAVIR